MDNIVSFDAEKTVRYLEQSFQGFLGDPPDSDYQRGFLAALLVLYEEGLGKGKHDARIEMLKSWL